MLLALLIIPWTYLLSLDTRDGALGWGGVGAIFMVEFGTMTLGLTAGIIALLRRERWLVLTVIALLLNLYPVFAPLFLYLTSNTAPHP